MHIENRKNPERSQSNTKRRTSGQALVEYALIIVLVVVALAVVLASTGSAIGNVFSNTVYNLLNATPVNNTLSPAEFWQNATAVASYTPPAITVYTWTPSGPQTFKPPVCTPYVLSIPKNTGANTPTPLNLLSKCDSVPSGQALTEVDPRGNPTDSISGLTTGTLNPSSVTGTGLVDYTPPVNYEGYVQFTYTVAGPGGLTTTGFVQITVGSPIGPIPYTSTPTPQPSSTPVDNAFSFPFYDGADTDSFWHYDFTNVVHGPWKREFFNGQGTTGTAASKDTIYWKSGQNTLDDTWTATPPSISSLTNFSVKYTATNVKLEARLYEVQIIANGPAKLTINGSTVLQITNPDDGTERVARGTFAGSASTTNVFILEYYQASGAARVQLAFNTLADQYSGCDWQDQTEIYHSVAKAWRNKFASALTVSSVCNLRLRGYIDLPSGGTGARLAFWEVWSLASPANAARSLQVGVRVYDASSPWVWVTVHNVPGASVNMNWKRQAFDLSNFGGSNFLGKRIEVAFRLNSGAATNISDLWAVDDLALEPNITNLYTPNNFTDIVADPVQSPLYWVNECGWARTAYQPRSGGTGWSWSDSPGDSANKNYKPNDDCSLVLNGLIDLTSYASLNVVPEVFFWSKALLGPGATLTAEWQLDTDTNNWQALVPSGSGAAWIAKGTSNDWSAVSVSLFNQRGKKIQFRFRLLADSNTAVDDGWYITEITIRDRISNTVGVPFYEPFDVATDVTTGGTWGYSKSVFYDTGSALSDSPTGQYGSLPTTAELNPSINIDGTTNPVLTFWTRWGAPTANLETQVSMDLGATWQNVWVHNAGGTTYNDVDTQAAWQHVKINLRPYLKAPVGTSTTGVIRIRFRIDPIGAPADGWYIDELRVEEDRPDVWQLSDNLYSENMDGASPKATWYNGGAWDINNTKAFAAQQWAVSQAWVSNPARYLLPALSSLEWTKAFDLCSTTSPTLYFWNTYNLESASELYVDISTDGGFTWPDPSNSTTIVNRKWTGSSSQTGLVNLGWHRAQVDLTPYVPSAAACSAATKPTPIRIRFVMNTLSSTQNIDGFFWAIDSVTVFDRKNLTDLGGSFTDGFTSIAPGSPWVTEGAWTNVAVTASPNLYGGWQYQLPSVRPLPATYTTSGGPVTTSNWAGFYYHTNSATVWGAGTNPTWPTVTANIEGDTAPGELNFDYSADPKLPYQNTVPAWNVSGLVNSEYYLMSWQRRYQTLNTTATTYRFRLRFAGGARLMIGPASGSAATARTSLTTVTPRTDLANPFVTLARPMNSPTYSWYVDPDVASAYFDYTFNPGTQYDVRVEFYHTTTAQSGPGKLELTMAEKSSVARTSPGTTNALADRYPPLYRTSIISNGVFTIPSGQLGNVSYNERWSLANSDVVVPYYSLDDGFTWVPVTANQHSANNPNFPSGSYQDWKLSTFQIKGTGPGGVFTSAARVMIKFEIDSRTRVDANTDEGWYIDDFTFVAALPSSYPPPSATSWSIVMDTNDFALTGQTPTVTGGAGDSFRYTIDTSPSRGTIGADSSDGLGNISFMYQPASDWAGTLTFNYTATSINSGASISGVASIQIQPKYATALNVGSTAAATAVVIPDAYPPNADNTWLAFSGNASAANATSGTTTISDGVAGRQTMLRSYLSNSSTSAGSPLTITLNNLSSMSGGGYGVYSFYVYFVETAATHPTFDMFYATNAVNRLLDSYSVPGTGTAWVKAGPFTVRFDSGTNFVLYFTAPTTNAAKVAGIELYKGEDVSNWTSMDITGATMTGANSTSGTATPGDPLILTASGPAWTNTGTSDSARFAQAFDSGSFDFISQVTMTGLSSGNTGDRAKVGLMIRDSAQTNASYKSIAYYALLIRSDGALLSQYRTTSGSGGTSATTTLPGSPGTSLNDPIWLWLNFVNGGTGGSTVKAYYSTMSTQPSSITTDPATGWKLIATQSITFSSAWVAYGFAGSEQANAGQTVTASFDNVTVDLN